MLPIGQRCSVGALGALLVLTLSSAPAVADDFVPTADVFAKVNSVRAFWHLPPLAVDPEMTQGCRNHVDYLHLNGTGEFHDETPGKPGYTAIGEKAAQRSNGGFDFWEANRADWVYSAPAHRWGSLSPMPLAAGLAQRREGANSYTCEWLSGFDDEDQVHVRVTDDPKPWILPYDGMTDVRSWERASEVPSTPAHDVGFAAPGSGPMVTGYHVFFYHDSLQGGGEPTYVSAICRSALLGPGGQPVESRALVRGILVPRDPFLNGGTYTALGTHTDAPFDWDKPTTASCGTYQDPSRASFTVEPRRPAGALLSLSDVVVHDGVPSFVRGIDRDMHLTDGTITYRFSAPGQSGFEWDMSDWWSASQNTESLPGLLDFDGKAVTVTMTSDRLEIGPNCWGPVTVRRTYTRASASTFTASPATYDVAADACSAPPVVSSATPGTGAPGTVVSLAGTGLTHAIRVTVGGVAATNWRSGATGLAVTVPTGAVSGPLTVTTPTGTASNITFTVPGTDSAPPDTRIDLAPPPATSYSTASTQFASTEGGGTFRCALDGEPTVVCMSPWVATNLNPGGHVLTITAVDAAGVPDPSPAQVSFTTGGDVPVTGCGTISLRQGATTLDRSTRRLRLGSVGAARPCALSITVSAKVGSRVRQLLAQDGSVGPGRRVVIAGAIGKPLVRSLGDRRAIDVTVRISTNGQRLASRTFAVKIQP